MSAGVANREPVARWICILRDGVIIVQYLSTPLNRP
jgi:hypothetical protein